LYRKVKSHVLYERGADEVNANNVSDSLIRIELITHFHRYPGLECSPVDIAEAIGRDLSRVEFQMKKLVQLRILDERPCEEGNRYRYIPPLSVMSFMGKNGSQMSENATELVEQDGELAG
jgi:DNA-binding IclR family transcriptional regulator